jgi:hypothetical protein
MHEVIVFIVGLFAGIIGTALVVRNNKDKAQTTITKL